MHMETTQAVSALVVASLLLCASAAGRPVSTTVAPTPSQVNRQNASAELDDIMARTLESMLAVTPCSTADPYFASAILPHRVGAAEMCDWMAKYGTDPQLRNISDAVYTSPTEIQIFQSMPDVEACTPAPGAAPASLAAPRAKAAGRLSQYPAVAIRSSIAFSLAAGMNGDPNHDFALQMAAHHMASINMARVELLHGTYAPLKALATELIVIQTKQVGQFRQILQNQYSTYI
ncbi:g12363 [Coccomyxa viridis]|uniref:G12363 protein n=1 Tax=Coccomyxa viridis TaxID=1274662 RepID=A0ABP1GA58_9CHLO